MRAEIWAPVAGFPSYVVSDVGRVRRAGLDARGHAPRILKPWVGNHGYEAVCLVEGDRRVKALIHRIVCSTFRGPPPTPLHQVAHGDGTRRNNRAENLRWATRSENMEDSRAHGVMALGARHGRTTKPERTPRGERHGHAKLTDPEILLIRDAPRTAGSGRALAARFGVSPSTISMIRSATTWKHVATLENPQ